MPPDAIGFMALLGLMGVLIWVAIYLINKHMPLRENPAVVERRRLDEEQARMRDEERRQARWKADAEARRREQIANCRNGFHQIPWVGKDSLHVWCAFCGEYRSVRSCSHPDRASHDGDVWCKHCGYTFDSWMSSEDPKISFETFKAKCMSGVHNWQERADAATAKRVPPFGPRCGFCGVAKGFWEEATETREKS